MLYSHFGISATVQIDFISICSIKLQADMITRGSFSSRQMDIESIICCFSVSKCPSFRCCIIYEIGITSLFIICGLVFMSRLSWLSRFEFYDTNMSKCSINMITICNIDCCCLRIKCILIYQNKLFYFNINIFRVFLKLEFLQCIPIQFFFTI